MSLVVSDLLLFGASGCGSPVSDGPENPVSRTEVGKADDRTTAAPALAGKARTEPTIGAELTDTSLRSEDRSPDVRVRYRALEHWEQQDSKPSWTTMVVAVSHSKREGAGVRRNRLPPHQGPGAAFNFQCSEFGSFAIQKTANDQLDDYAHCMGTDLRTGISGGTGIVG